MPKNYENRDKKLKKRKNEMKVNSRGLITVILPLLGKKSKTK
jgi:hypothetical protein